MQKKTVSESTLKEVTELQAKAAVAKQAALDANSKEIESSRSYELKLNDLKIKIVTGSYTTGDRLLDFNIVVNSSTEKDERYDAMVEFEEALATHPGELIAEARRTSYIEKVGLLPESPALQLRVGGAYGRERVYGGDSTVSIVLPVFDETGIVREVISPLLGGPQGRVMFGTNILFEEELQRALDDQPNMNLAVKLWSDAQILGRPLQARSELTGVIALQRESCALELHAKIGELQAGLEDLKNAQNSPSSWGLSQTELDGHNVIVSFPGNVGRIKRVRRDLVMAVNQAARLGMGKEPMSPTYEKAVALLETTKAWDD